MALEKDVQQLRVELDKVKREHWKKPALIRSIQSNFIVAVAAAAVAAAIAYATDLINFFKSP